jgi:hypothetical protein
VLEQKKAIPSPFLSFLFFTQRNDHSVFNFSSFMADWSGSLQKTENTLRVRVFLFSFESIPSVGFCMAGIECWLGSRYVTIKVIWLERLAGCLPARVRVCNSRT